MIDLSSFLCSFMAYIWKAAWLPELSYEAWHRT